MIPGEEEVELMMMQCGMCEVCTGSVDYAGAIYHRFNEHACLNNIWLFYRII